MCGSRHFHQPSKSVLLALGRRGQIGYRSTSDRALEALVPARTMGVSMGISVLGVIVLFLSGCAIDTLEQPESYVQSAVTSQTIPTTSGSFVGHYVVPTSADLCARSNCPVSQRLRDRYSRAARIICSIRCNLANDAYDEWKFRRSLCGADVRGSRRRRAIRRARGRLDEIGRA